MRVILVGNPNAGKSTLFHALTQLKLSGQEALEGHGTLLPDIQFIDLPGFYSLNSGQTSSVAMQFAAQELLNNTPDLIINVVNVCELEKQLLLSTQLMELGLPMVVVLTHADEIKQSINKNLLAQLIGLPVYNLKNHQASEIHQFCSWIQSHLDNLPQHVIPWPRDLQSIFSDIQEPGKSLFALRRYLESADLLRQQESLTDDLYQKFVDMKRFDGMELKELDVELLMMDARYNFIHQIVQKVLPCLTPKQQNWTRKLDQLLLHRFWGWPIFIAILWVFFSLAIDIGGSFQQTLTSHCEWFFQHPLTSFLKQLGVSKWVKWLLVDGLGTGISTMLSFLPVMAFMNLFLTLLEASGYMSRVAFLFERMMRSIGLPGKAFLPLLIGFGCNVPAIMSARMVDGSKERLLTVLLSPFMSCSARLTIYAVFASLFFPQSGGFIVLSLYLLGILMAIMTGLLLRKFWLAGNASPMMMDLPLYRLPSIKRLLKDVYFRLKMFLIRSGALVVPFCAVLGTFQAAFQQGWMISDGFKTVMWLIWENGLHPILAPIGISLENWPAAVSLLTGTMAKEIVVATLNTLYSQMPHILQNPVIPVLQPQFVFLNQLIVLPASMTEHLTAQSSRALMWAFGGPAAAYSYLLFVLLYIPCISTLAIIRQEVGFFWQWFALIWSLILAYSISCLFYQTATLSLHPWQTLGWWGLMLGLWAVIILTFHYWKPKYAKHY
jgi:ferrous iron transport protein B